MALPDEVSSDFREILAERGTYVEWGASQRFKALVTTPGIDYGMASGGWDATSTIQVRALREDIGAVGPVRGARLTIGRRTYKVTGMPPESDWPIAIYTAELITP